MAKNVVVVGGGPAGMIAAGTAAKRGHKVILVEKNEDVGKKLLITGNGRCNVTNNCDVEELIENIVVNKYFLYSAFYTFSNQNLIDLLDDLGIKTKIEENGRIFPVSDRACDIVNALKKYMKQNNVKIVKGKVCNIIVSSGKVKGVKLEDGRKLTADSVIIATGGLSYPSTGCTGDGYKFAKNLGINVVKPQPSLVPIEVKEKWVKQLMGVSLNDVCINICDKNNKSVYKKSGSLLFTHFGISGPLVINGSTHIKNINDGGYKVILDLKPEVSMEELNSELIHYFETNSKKQISNVLTNLVSSKLVPIILNLSNINNDKRASHISKDERLCIANSIKKFVLHIVRFRSFKEAVITSGGINIKEIDPSTMCCKNIEGLYFAGEVIDVHGYTGGFNLQIAFSTGYTAGLNC